MHDTISLQMLMQKVIAICTMLLAATASGNNTNASSLVSPKVHTNGSTRMPVSMRKLQWVGPDSIDTWSWTRARATYYGGPDFPNDDIHSGSCGFQYLNNKYITGAIHSARHKLEG